MKDLDLNKMYGDQKVDIKCDACEKIFQVPFMAVVEDESSFVCPHCQSDNIINHDETTRKTLSDIKKSLDEYNKKIEKFNKEAKKFGIEIK